MMDDERGGACSTHWREEMHAEFKSKHLVEMGSLRDLDMGGNIIL
jgi:hypothetical protein